MNNIVFQSISFYKVNVLLLGTIGFLLMPLAILCCYIQHWFICLVIGKAMVMITILQVRPLVEPLDWIRPNRKIIEQEKRNRIKNVCIRRHHNNTLHASMLLLEIQTYIFPFFSLLLLEYIASPPPPHHSYTAINKNVSARVKKRGIGARQKFKSVRLNPVNFTWNHFTSFLSSLLLSHFILSTFFFYKHVWPPTTNNSLVHYIYK